MKRGGDLSELTRESASASPVCSTATVDDLVTLIRRLCRRLKKADPDSGLPELAMDYLDRCGLKSQPLRKL